MANHDNMGPGTPGSKSGDEEIKIWQPRKSDSKKKKSFIYEVPSAEPEPEPEPDAVMWTPDKKNSKKYYGDMHDFQNQGGEPAKAANAAAENAGPDVTVIGNSGRDSSEAEDGNQSQSPFKGTEAVTGGSGGRETVAGGAGGRETVFHGNESRPEEAKTFRKDSYDWKKDIHVKREPEETPQELSPEERRKSLKKGMIEGSKNSISAVKRGIRFFRSYGGKIFVALILLAVLLGGLKFYNRIRTYKSFRTDWQVSATDSGYSSYLALGDKILHYSQDGVNVLDQDGNILWDQAFNMDVPAVAVKDDYVLIYDVKGKDFYICNSEGCTGNGTTEKKILKGDISASGVVALVLDDKKCNYIDYYRKDATKIELEIKTLITGDGYPLDIAISPDGVELMTSYIYASGGKMLSEVVFRNFEVGKNDADRVVGGFRDYEETLVPDVMFFDDQNSAAVTESSVDFYSTKNALRPECAKHEPFTEAIRSVASNESYIAVILEAAEEVTETEKAKETTEATEETTAAEKGSKKKSKTKAETAAEETKPQALSYGYQLKVYDKTGKAVFDEFIDFPYTNMNFSGDGLFVFNESTCAMYDMSGVCKYKGSLNVDIEGLMRFGDKTIIAYGNSALQKITLK